MPDESFHGQRSRERVAPNVYRRRTKAGAAVFECDAFATATGRQRVSVTLVAQSERDAVRRAGAMLRRTRRRTAGSSRTT